MRFGFCMAVESEGNMRAAAACGADYVEANFKMLAEADRAKQKTVKDLVAACQLSCEAANCFLPGELKTSGSERSDEALADYIKRGLDFGCELGLKTVVFGSGGARQIPEELSFYEGMAQNIDFLQRIALPLFEQYGVMLVIEPLSPAECNFIHTVKEAAMLSYAVSSPHLAVLADIYHMKNAADGFGNIRDLKGIVRHAHISNPQPFGEMKRIYPRLGEEYDYIGFLSALTAAGCETCSVEASTKDFAQDAPLALRALKDLKVTED